MVKEGLRLRSKSDLRPVQLPPLQTLALNGTDQMLPDLYLIRHGETEWNCQQRLQGRRDSPLTDRGRAQARALRDVARALEADGVSSPQGRAVKTAQLLFGRAFRTDQRLVEIDTGAFTGARLADLGAAHPDLFSGAGLGWYDRCPDGEGFAALEARCRDFLEGLAGPTAIVGHGITLRMIWAIATGAGVAGLADAPLEQGCILAVTGAHSRVLTATNGLASPAI